MLTSGHGKADCRPARAGGDTAHKHGRRAHLRQDAFPACARLSPKAEALLIADVGS